MKRFLYLVMIMLLSVATPGLAKERTVKIKVVHTTDVHGNCFPYNFITRSQWKGSMARVASFVKQERKQYGKNLILLDNGDMLQGQPTAYYYNFIHTSGTHLCASIFNYLKYDVANIGNHDVETGHEVYDRLISQCDCPFVGANTIEKASGKPYLKPYIILERDGVKVAVFGLITPAIPAWLAENLWSGLYFEDMVKSASQWIPYIQENEKPDLIIGLFHAGQDISKSVEGFAENASLEVARRVPGFDIVLFGHDHMLEYKIIQNSAHQNVVLANSAANAVAASNIEITFTLRDGKVVNKSIMGGIENINKYQPDAQFMEHFKKQFSEVQEFVSEKIGVITESISTRDAYFGSSAFVDLIHRIQLETSGADISFAAPLSFDATIAKGDILMSDMFNLMKYENMLYVMNLSGKEIKDFLEYSYYIWTNQMSSPDDHMLWLKSSNRVGDENRSTFYNESFNFDSAAGIIYTVDLTKPRGEKINIISMADGTPFALDHTYKVAINSYRGNGGGGHLTAGAQIDKDELKSRIISATDKDLRFYMLEYIRAKGTIDPKPLNNWKFIPDDYVEAAKARDYKIIFKQ